MTYKVDKYITLVWKEGDFKLASTAEDGSLVLEYKAWEPEDGEQLIKIVREWYEDYVEGNCND